MLLLFVNGTREVQRSLFAFRFEARIIVASVTPKKRFLFFDSRMFDVA